MRKGTGLAMGLLRVGSLRVGSLLVGSLLAGSLMQAQPVRIVGSVTDEAHQPLPGAAVWVHAPSDSVALASCFTDSLGRYELRLPHPQVVYLHIHFLGYAECEHYLNVQRDTVFDHSASVDPNSLSLVEVTERKAGILPPNVVQVTAQTLTTKLAGQTLSEALAQTPGVNFISTGPGVSKPVLRGQFGNRVAVVENGLRQESQQWGAEHGLPVDPNRLSGARLHVGPLALAWGPDALAGVVELLPETPLLPAGTVQAQAEAMYRSVNRNWMTTARVQGGTRHLSMGLRLSTQDYADLSVPADSFTYNRYRLPLPQRQLANTAGHDRMLSAFAHGLWGGTRLVLQGSYFEQQAGFFPGAFGIPRSYQLQPDGNLRNTALPNALVQHSAINAQLQMALHGRHRQQLEVSVGAQHNLRHEYSSPHAHGDQFVAPGSLALQLRLWTLALRVEHQLEMGRLKLTNGLQLQGQQHQRGGYEYLLPSFRQGQAGLFTLATWAAGRNLSLNGALRADAWSLSTDAYVAVQRNANGDSLGLDGRAQALKRQALHPTGALAVQWQALPQLLVMVAGGHGMRFPQPVELAGNGVHHGTFRHEQGDPDLGIERAWQTELRVQYGGWIRASISPFLFVYPSYLYLNPEPRFSTLPEGGQLYAYRQDAVRLWGTEAQLERQQGRHLLLQAGLALVHSTNLSTRLGLPFQPPLQWRLKAEWTQKLANWSLLAYAQTEWNDAQTRTTTNEPATPAWWRLDAGLRAQHHWKNWQISAWAAGQNLLNAAYLRHLSRYRILNLPEAGRNAVLGLSLTFH